MTAPAENAVPSPTEDLYRHVNGEWLASHEIPSDQGAYGAFLELRDNAELAVRHLCEDAVRAVGTGHDAARARVEASADIASPDTVLDAASADAPEQTSSAEDAAASDASSDDTSADRTALRRRIAALYTSFMDEEVVEARGVAPIAGDLAAIETVETPEQLLTLSGALQRHGVSGLINTGAMNDAGDPERMLLHLLQGGLGLPDESYYREDSYAEIVSEYRAHLGRMLALAGIGADEAEASEIAGRVVDLETKIASHHWDVVRSRDAVARYNLLTRAQLDETFPLAQAWLEGIGAAGTRSDEVVVWQPDFLAGVQSLLAGEDAVDLQTWKHWLEVQVLRSFAAYLPEAFVQENFSFYGRRLAGTEEVRPRWKRAVAFVNSAAGEDVAQLYVAKHYPAGHQDQMDRLVGLLNEAYRRSISRLDWMGEDTRQRALEKLSMFRPMVGFPSKWIDYSTLEVDADDLLGNARRADEFAWDWDLAKIEKGPDPEEWHMTPQTVNAYYSPLENAIVFPAAILQPPFFDPERSMAANLGGIGAVIGHEIGHGFDDQGSRYDGTGTLKNWWTDEDREAFSDRTAKLVAQYSALSPAEAPDHHVNGEFTLGENIGDLGGLGIAHQALEIWREEQSESADEDTAAQDREFFSSWASVWRQLTRPETMVTRIASDPHSPNEFRCNQVVKNLDAFHAAYGTTEQDPMWLAPEERVSIW
ncbi:putative peptidase [Micrococcus lylae]|uniref:M13 family peptidase n=1 Tax=Micrococcus lylae TaxID=1273 RepID=A0A1R4JE52_9MICC|nr:M13-type metalloendopeptidase [Micrococcus lylae]TFH99982.1 M13 family peptidase [Micrococcus lylae]WIK81918.1 M13-type metalloendopeptidase [Micrococcus lylae]SJN30292.1 putative peptidase [Micrococcus lylae]